MAAVNLEVKSGGSREAFAAGEDELRLRRRTCAVLVPACFLSALQIGCQNSYRVEVDLSNPEPRFLMHEVTWGWPARWPRVNALAIGADDESLWEIEAVEKSGVQAKHLAIVYGQTPAGFVQNYPPRDARPRKLTQGRTYFVGATGPNNEIFRTIFALPVGPMGRPVEGEFAPDRKRMDEPPGSKDPPKPAG
ncbi:MAG: hypothetical protein KF841_16195 [Phycisphaerae bacterium]|nr:hypothetical protein [Phycisphaerae bacterium]